MKAKADGHELEKPYAVIAHMHTVHHVACMAAVVSEMRQSMFQCLLGVEQRKLYNHFPSCDETTNKIDA